MFSYLRNGDIHNGIRGLTNLPGLFTSDGDKIKYALLNHSTAIRKNLGDGAPIFNGIRAWEAEIETRDIGRMMNGVLPSMAANAATSTHHLSLFSDNDLRIDNAALALIMAKELAFLNRTIQMITLIANRYNEEQEDLAWGCDDGSDSDNGDNGDNGGADLEYGDASPLLRSQSHDNPPAAAAAASRQSSLNQLATTFLIASGRLIQKFNGLCELAGTNVILVNAMTTRDQPHSSAANLEKQLAAQSLVVSDIFLHFRKFDAQHRDPVVLAFLELRDISVYACKIMSMFAFSNLFRLTAGTDFDVYQPDDAIFTQGRDYCINPSISGDRERLACVSSVL